ncbi:MAG: carboxypeptidase regulatory-like domain-containing protein [Chlamydiales bacterium]
MINKLFCLMLGFAICLVCIPNPNVRAYEFTFNEDGGDVIGTVRYKGVVPEIAHLKVDRNSEFCGPSVSDESLMVNHENGGIKNVVVSIENVTSGKRHEPATITIDNFKCQFIPRIQAGMIGDLYELKNSDPIIHNTLFHLENDDDIIISVALPPFVNPIKRPIMANEGIIHVKCNAHPFMHANILVFKHPYFATTDENGSFEISNIPPGHYKVKIWHETLPVQESELKIISHQRTILNLSLSAKN